MKIRVTADSTCDLSPELRASYGITLAPLTVMLGEDAFHDGVNVTPQDIIHAVENGKTCKTAAVNVYEYEELFRRVKEDCDAVIHLCIGKKFSACYDNACQAAKQCGNVYVVDSGNLSVGLGMMALDAVEMARAGKTPQEIVQALEAERDLIDTSFVLDQVDYLRNGGRCSGVAGVGAMLLHIKPCIEVEKGVMVVGKKYRGSFARCLEHYVKDKLEDRSQVDFSRVMLAYSPCEPGVAEQMLNYLGTVAEFKETLVCTAGSTICCHCGPNTLGIIFKRKTPKA